jgi:hypothetical protein
MAMGYTRTGEGYFTEQHSADHNLIPKAGIKYLLNVIFGSTSKESTWYVGLIASNHSPDADWTSVWAGATSGPEATELNDSVQYAAAGSTGNSYTASGRPAATFGSAADGSASGTGTIATSSATAFTLHTGSTAVSIYGATLNSTATCKYNGTAGDEVLIAATLFGSAKTGLSAADIINVSYSITGSSS